MRDRIVNASPLVFLSKLDRLEALRLGAASVVVPSAVVSEIRTKRDIACSRIEGCLETWLEECDASAEHGTTLPASLGSGERHVLLQAIARGIPEVVLDDLEARRVARRLGMETIGTIGLLLLAKRGGVFPSLSEEIERLKELGFRISGALEAEVLRDAGEAGT